MTRRTGPGETLLSPWALGAVAVFVLNDHVLKGSGLLPSVVTGKLSDAAGLVFFPLFLEGLWEAVAASVGCRVRPSRTRLLTCVVMTGLVFAGVQIIPAVDWAWRWSLGTLQYPFRASWAFLTGNPGSGLRPIASWPDVTDLLMLPFLLLAYGLGLSRGRSGWPARRLAEAD